MREHGKTQLPLTEALEHARSERERLLVVIDEASADRRQVTASVIVMARKHGMTWEAIGQALGVSYQAAMKLHKAAMNKLPHTSRWR